MIYRYMKRPAILSVVFSLIVLSMIYMSKANSQIGYMEKLDIVTDTDTATKAFTESTGALTTTNEKETKPKDTLVVDASDYAIQPFMPKMENETLKQELGRATWKLLHTVLARYPEKPSEVEKNSLGQFFNYFVKVYPCGDCASHFQKLLDKYPPQLKSKQSAAMWGCMIHNKVNERLNKPEFNCTNILNDYDCGCGSEEATEESDDFKQFSSSKKTNIAEKKNFIDEKEHKDHLESIQIESVEGLQKGG